MIFLKKIAVLFTQAQVKARLLAINLRNLKEGKKGIEEVKKGERNC